MIRLQRLVVVAIAAVLLLSVAAPAFAGQSGGDAETTEVVVPISAGDEPAVVIPPPEADETEQPWTSRFLIPLLVVTAIPTVIGVVIIYNRSIRHHYRVAA